MNSIKKTIKKTASVAKKKAASAGVSVKKGTIQLKDKTAKLSKEVNKKV